MNEIITVGPTSDAPLVRRVENRMPKYIQLLSTTTARYYVFYGGRGGAKSWGVSRWILQEGINRPLRVLCARELQNSMKESVYQLLVDQIQQLGLQAYYIIKETEIVGRNDTKINFSGLRSLKGDPTKLKSYEGIDVLWIEEAVKVLQSSFETIDPTIRKAGAKIIITYNPELETDYIHQTFVVNTPPPDSIVRLVSWRDNKHFPESLKKIMDYKRETDFDGYLNIWEGKTRLTLEGAVYAEELRQARLLNRIREVPYDPTCPVHTFWDIGHGDGCAIWFAQIVGFEYRIINFYQNRLKGPQHYIEVLQNLGYVYGTDYMPHDADYAQFAAEGRTVKDIMLAAGRTVQIVKRPTNKAVTFGAVRTIFPLCYFDLKKTSDGIQCLGHYRFEIDPQTKQYSSTRPVHDENSHPADAFGTLALYLTREPIETRPTELDEVDLRPTTPQSWMY